MVRQPARRSGPPLQSVRRPCPSPASWSSPVRSAGSGGPPARGPVCDPAESTAPNTSITDNRPHLVGRRMAHEQGTPRRDGPPDRGRHTPPRRRDTSSTTGRGGTQSAPGLLVPACGPGTSADRTATALPTAQAPRGRAASGRPTTKPPARAAPGGRKAASSSGSGRACGYRPPPGAARSNDSSIKPPTHAGACSGQASRPPGNSASSRRNLSSESTTVGSPGGTSRRPMKPKGKELWELGQPRRGRTP